MNEITVGKDREAAVLERVQRLCGKLRTIHTELCGVPNQRPNRRMP